MQLTLQATAVFVRLGDPNFPVARMWTGVTGDGTRVRVLVACVSSCDELAQPQIDARMNWLPAPQLFLTSQEAAPLSDRMIA